MPIKFQKIFFQLGLSPDNDLAIVKVKESFQYSPNVSPILLLPDSTYYPPGIKRLNQKKISSMYSEFNFYFTQVILEIDINF